MARSKKALGNKKTAPSSSKGERDGLPLFFKQPQPLQAERHRNAGLNPLESFSFAENTNSIALNLVEFFEAARNYPIVFTASGKTMPVALLGIAETNGFVDGKGRWLERCYIPAYLRRYPFIFMEDLGQNRLILCVDEAAPHYTEDHPQQPFFDDAGEMAPLTRQALQFCTLYQQHHLHTVAFCQALKEWQLLAEKSTVLQLPGGKELSLSGFCMLDGERLAALPDDVFLEWRKKGWIAAADAVMVSYTNWKYIAELIGERMQAAS